MSTVIDLTLRVQVDGPVSGLAAEQLAILIEAGFTELLLRKPYTGETVPVGVATVEVATRD